MIWGKGIIVFLTLLLIVSQSVVIFANNEGVDIKDEAINPASFYYPFKRLWEKGREKLLFSQQSRISFYDSLLKSRLSELNYVVNKNLLSEVQGSSERFAYQAGILTEEIVKQNKSDNKERFVKKFEQDENFLSSLRDKYPANSSFWMLVQHDINTLKILTDRLPH